MAGDWGECKWSGVPRVTKVNIRKGKEFLNSSYCIPCRPGKFLPSSLKEKLDFL
jgi:hypothetical protein